MRSWIWYKTGGEIGGEERMAPGGWPTSLDLNDPTAQDAAVRRVRSLRTTEPDFAGFLPFDCDCAQEEKICACACDIPGTHKVVEGNIVEKPSYSIVFGDKMVSGTGLVDATPGADVPLYLEGPLPDGAEIFLVEPAGATISVLGPGPNVLTFVGGVSNTVTIVGPPRANIVRLALRPQDARNSAVRGLRIRGW
jgi:hypothetical protein